MIKLSSTGFLGCELIKIEYTIVWFKYSQQILPPVHDRCHCYIEVMPAGNKIWQTTNEACNRCRSLALEFNKNQNTIVNRPAQINPPVPEPPALMPEQESGLDKTIRNYRYTPRRFF